MTRKLIIDTDTGVDDAQAIMMALAHPETEVSAITMVMGNVAVTEVTKNVPRVLDQFDTDVPYYIGADRPLVQPYVDAADVHGNDGLGNADIPQSSRQPEEEHAVLALIRLINEAPNEYEIIALGPLTNLALAVRLDPSLPAKVKRLVIMGGTIGAVGNTSALAEYNFYADPEAAQVAIEAFGAAEPYPELISWETTLAHTVSLDVYDAWCAHKTNRSDFFQKISGEYIGRILARKSDQYAMPDPLAMGILLEPSLIEKQSVHFTAVELAGQWARGQLMVDYRRTVNGLTLEGNRPNLTIVQQVNQAGFEQLVDASVR